MLDIGERLKAHEVAKLALKRDPANKKALAIFDATNDEYNAWSSQ